MSTRFEGFADTRLAFFRAVATHQDKAWFAAHKAEYEDGWRGPMEAFLAEAKERLDVAYPHLELGEPKVFRIYRDVRFSKDKSPYKTHVAGAVPVRLRAGGMDAPTALYVNLGVEEGCFAGAGTYFVQGPKLERLRAAIVDDARGKELVALARALAKRGYTFGAAETLKRPPKGVPPDHPRAEWLRRKGLVAMFPELPREALTSRAVLDWAVRAAKAAAPLVEWVSFALA